MSRSTVLLFVFVFAAACDGTADKPADTATDTAGDTQTDSGTDSGGDTGGASGRITLLSPVEAGVSYFDVSVVWEVTNFTLDSANIGSTAVEGAGHVHVYIDDEYTYDLAETSITLTEADISPGTHTVEVRLAGNDHAESYELGQQNFATATFDVLVPEIDISEPVEGASLESAGVYVAYNIYDFAVVNEVELPNGVGRGHVHLLVNGLYHDLSIDQEGGWFLHLPPGEHALGVALVNNDHSAITAGLPTDTVTVTVPELAPDITFASSFAGEWNSGTIPVNVAVENFVLDPEGIGDTNVPGQGNFNLYLDGAPQGVSGLADSYVYNVAPGEHTLTVALAGNDGTELGARAVQTFTVAANRPDLGLTSPANGETVAADFAVVCLPENFILDEAGIGSDTNAEGTGHIHLSIDDIYYTADADGQFDVVGLAPGAHELRVELRNNDHSELVPRVFDVATVTVL